MNKTECTAWLLSIAPGLRAAIGEQEMHYLIPGRQRFQPIPVTEEYCRMVFVWQRQLIPLFDLHLYLQPGTAKRNYTSNEDRHTCIINYRDLSGRVQHGAFLLTELPVRIPVSNEQLCDLPDEIPGLENICHSCFASIDDEPIPVLHLNRVFTSIRGYHD